MTAPTKPIPEGHGTVTPYLVVNNADAAIAFYVKAFGAEEIYRMTGPGNAVMHLEMMIGTSRVYLSGEFPGMGGPPSPTTLGGSPVSLHLYVPDADAGFAKAVAAGATAVMPPMDAFWGDRYCKLQDPFGHHWSIATNKETLTPAQIQERMAQWMSSQAK